MPRRQLTNEQREQSRKRRLERDRERQRRRRLDPQLRAIERGRNTVAKRLSRAKGLYDDNIRLYSKDNIGCNKIMSLRNNIIIVYLLKHDVNFNQKYFRLEEKYMLDIEEQNELKKEREKERQRKRRMDPEFRAKERVRNRTLKRISRQKNYYIQKVQYLSNVGNHKKINSTVICTIVELSFKTDNTLSYHLNLKTKMSYYNQKYNFETKSIEPIFIN